MDLLNNKKLNHLVSELNRRKPHLVGNVSLKLQMALTVPAVLLAKQIQEYAPEILKKDEVTVIVAGAAFNEIMNKCRSYYLLNTLLQTNIKWKIFLIGNETSIAPPPHYFELTKHYIEEPVSIEMSPMLLGESLDCYGIPDLLVLNHPGLEIHYESWFIEDKGIDRCLKSGVPIVGCSYGTDEIQIDDFYAQAFGLTLKHTQNNLYIDMSEKPSPNMKIPKEFEAAARTGMMDWGRTIWAIDPVPEGLCQNETILSTIRDMDEVRSSVNRYLMHCGIIESPYECYDQYLRWEDHRKILRVYGNYSLDITNGVIFDEESLQIMKEDVELDTSDVNMNNLSIHEKILLMCQVYKNYIAENLEDIDEHDESANDVFADMFDDPNTLKDLLGDGYNSNFEGVSLNDVFGFRKNRELSDQDEAIKVAVYGGDIERLRTFNVDALRQFSTEKHKNLIHIAADKDDLTLLKLAIDAGVKINGFDGDHCSVLDACCEAPVSLQVLKYLLSNGLVEDLINRQDARGFTALYRAASSRSKEAYDLLKSYGADELITAGNGMNAKEISSFAFNSKM